jgi:hypothetical protein
MQSKATTPTAYLASLPADRRAALKAVRNVIRANIDKPFAEGMQYGMIGYFLPHSVYPDGYHCDPKQPLPFAGLASQKNHMSLYLMCIYGDAENEAWFRKEWAKSGKKLDMGKSCIRFKKAEDLALDVIAKVFKRVTARKFVAHYEDAIQSASSKRKSGRASKSVTKKAASKKASTVKAAGKRKATGKKVARKAAKKPARKARAKSR